MSKKLPCPCCGYSTLNKLKSYDICKVCFWEDDGQDNHNAAENTGGPNYISLEEARINFILHGVFDLNRKQELMVFLENRNNYTHSRFFKLKAIEVSEIKNN